MEEEFRIKDEASSPVKAMTEALHGLTEALKSSAGASEKAEYGYGKLGRAAKEAGEHAEKAHKHDGGGFFSSLIPEIAAGELAAEGLKKLAEAAVEGVKFAIEASEFKENMVDAYGAIQGGAEEGEKTFKEIDALAKKIHAPTEKAHELAQRLMLSGLENTEAVTETIKAVTALQRTGLEAGAQKLQMIVERGEAAGHFDLSAKMLKGTGTGVDAVYRGIAERLHVNQANVKAMIKAGQVDVETGVLALDEAVNLGRAGQIAAKRLTLSDVMVDAKNTIRGLFQEANSGPIVDAFGRIADSIKPGTEGAEKFKATLDGIISAVAGLIDLGGQLASWGASAFKAAHDAADGTLSALKEAAEWAAKIAGRDKKDEAWSAAAEKDVDRREDKQIRAEISKKAMPGSIDVDTWAAAEDARNATGQVAVGQERSADEARDRGLHAPGEVEDAHKTGADIGTGIADGIRSTLPALEAAGHEAGKTTLRGAKEATGSHSPSRKMAELGRGMTDGFALGIEDGIGDAQGALEWAVRPPDMAPANGNGGSRHVEVGGIHVEIHTGAHAEEIVALLESQLVDALERAAMEAGA